jgi:signal transduction histidine kinase
MARNLSIPSKLIVLLSVPVTGAVLLGVAAVAGGFGERARAGQEVRVATAAGQAAAAAHELQEERVRAVAWLVTGGRAGQAELAARRRRADRALAAYRAAAAGLGRTGDPGLDPALAEAGARLDRLPVVRAETDRRLVPPELAGGGHDALVDALLAVTRGLAAHLDAPGPSRAARLLLAVATAKEATGQERTLLATVPAGGKAKAAAADEQVLRVRLVARAAVARGALDGMRAAAGDRLGEVDRELGGAGVREVRRLELALLDPVAGPAPAGDLAPWRDGLAARAGALRRVERSLAGDLVRASAAWLAQKQRRLRDWLLLAGAVLVATLAAAAATVPAAAGRREPAPAPAATVLGLARRGQALADRQLQLLDGLARDEPDPQRHRDLLGLDNLAGRLRRTAETVLALAGPGPVRARSRPLPVDAVLRAAVAEAEPGGAGAGGSGRRVDLLTTGDVEVAGPAAVDLVHLLAELLDNAAAFSPPAAPIVVTGAAEGDGYLVEVTDRGLGMTDQELAWANQRLAGRGPAARRDAHAGAAGDRLGLVVAGRLAGRNGFQVRLGRSPAGGISAVVRLPAAVLAPAAAVPVRRH